MGSTSSPIRQEVNDNRRLIRSQSNDFLNSTQFNTSDYAELNYIFASNILEERGAINTAILPPYTGVRQGISAPDSAISGALQPAIPMYISLADKKNKKLQFMMLINPANMTHGKTSTVSAAYTRKGFVTQMWGPNQDLITSTGKTAAFMVEGSGLTNLARRRSLAYANFLAFVFAYRNNGYLMLDPTKLDAILTRVINVVHGVEIAYDNQIFTGHFNNFTIDEAAERPFLFDYNFEFVCTTLDDNYDEIRGHYLPIGVTSEEAVEKTPVLLEEIGETSEIDTSVFKTVPIDNYNQPMDDPTDSETGRLSPSSISHFDGDLTGSVGIDNEIAELERQLALLEG